MTIADALNVATRSISFRDAEVLLGFVTNHDRSWLHAHPEHELSAGEATTYAGFLDRREDNEPVAYITGIKEFYGRPFNCDARALIPRPETESVIDRALAILTPQKEPYRILELGTGCGNISVTLSLELAARSINAEIIATDVSSDALELAQDNAKKLNTPENLTFVQGDMFRALELQDSAPYDLILANLPYVADTWKIDPRAQRDVLFFEPDLALFGGGTDGLALYREFWKETPGYLKADGRVIIEYGEDQTPAMLPLIEQAFPGKKATVYKDYADLDRVLEVA